MHKIYIKIIILLLSSFTFSISSAQESILLNSAKKELERTLKELSTQPKAPYFLSYNITESVTNKLNASFGKIENENSNKERILDIDLRVGDYQFDNTHIIRGSSFSFGSGRSSVELPLEDNETAIRSAIWYATDRFYKKAIETYDKAKTNKAVKVQEEDSSADFSREIPAKYNGPDIELKVDLNYWKDRIRRLSELFSKEKFLYEGNVSFTSEHLTKYFISSEGSEIKSTEPSVRVMVYAKTKADDGMSLPLYKSYFAFSPDSLPAEDVMVKDIEKLIATLKALKTAPLMTTFSGPAILSGEASGVFFHEIFGHRVEGHRQKDPNSSQTFKNYIGKKILPEFIDVVFDPTRKYIDGRQISGFYKFDDQGVEGKKVVTVEKGIFKDFLMSRSPIENFSKSNGHGRKQAGYKACSRQSNLLVLANATQPVELLKEMLRIECHKQNKDFGLYFETVQGGFTFTGRSVPNAFNVQPLVVYKIYADGKPDELVRGVDLIGTPLTTFNNVIAAGDDIGIFNGICGAESGGVPVSASSPSLLVSLIEVQKKQKSQAKPPILEAP